MPQKLKQYRLGNMLRGTVSFKARTIKEAWNKGCRRFNACFPTEKNSSGRAIVLEVWDSTQITLTTQWMYDQNKLKPKDRLFTDHEDSMAIGFMPVAFGMSKQKLIFKKI